jgi:hypothetical protein
MAFLTAAVPSNNVLSQLYSNLVSTGVQSVIYNYLEQPSVQSTYNTMVPKIVEWLTASSTKNSVGVTNSGSLNSLRVTIVLPDGRVSYDSGKSTNSYTNIALNAVNENHNTRSHVMNALLSNTGVAFQIKYSNSVNIKQHYVAVRQGSQQDPLGTIIVSMNDLN